MRNVWLSVMGAAVVAAFCLDTGVAAAAEWGHLTGVVQYAGRPPKPERITVDRDEAFCGKHKLIDESLIVKRSNQGLANVVVWLERERGEPVPPIHSTYRARVDEPVVLAANQCRFEPHVALLWTRRPLTIQHRDPIGHNFNFDFFSNPPPGILVPAGSELTMTIPEAERLPVSVECKIHPWMQGWLVVKSHPYMAVSDEDGRFEIKHLPAGDWTFRFWHESAGYLDKATLNGECVEWPRGQVELSIDADKTTDLGVLAVDAQSFEE